MAEDFRFGRIFTLRGDKQLAPEHLIGGEFSLTMTLTSTVNRIATACLFLALLTACGGVKTQEAAKQYQLRGEITGLDAGGHVATIKHEEIKGFMGAMTMGYPVKDASEFSKLSVGEPITATVYVSGDDMWVGNIQKNSGAPKQP